MVARILVLVLVAASLSGCPRGETRTLTEIIASAKSEFAAQNVAAAPADLQPLLRDISQKLVEIADRKPSQDIKAQSSLIADALATIITRAGFTARPGIGELQQQFRMLGEGSVNPERLRDAAALLAARTLSALAAELHSTHFAI